MEYKHDKVLQSQIVFLTLTRHHQGYLDFDLHMHKNNLCKSTIKPFLSSHLPNTVYSSYLVEAIEVLNDNRNKLNEI